MSTIPSLSSVTDILDTDQVMITHSDGQSFKIAGSELNKRNQIIIASSTTITGTPLKTGNVVRVYFTADILGANTTSALVINYNGTNYNVKAPKNGALVNFVASNLGGSPVVYKYLQAYTTLELLYDGTQFVIIGNPVVISTADYTIYTDGSTIYNGIASRVSQKRDFTDFNDCIPPTEGEFYFYQSAYQPANRPSVARNFFICVAWISSRVNNTVSQIALTYDGAFMKYRLKQSGGWGEWGSIQ